MSELAAMSIAATQPSAREPALSADQPSKRVMEVLFGVQRVLLEQGIFAAEEWFDRARTETHLLAELASRLAEAHSVNNIKAMCEECGQHQIDFIRRDCERIFKHNGRMLEALSNLAAKT